MENKATKVEIVEQLTHLINFIENMEAIAKNPYSAGLKIDALLEDVKQYIRETIDKVQLIEEVTEDFVGQPDSAESEEN